MEQGIPPEWAEMFRGKTYDELLKLDAPEGLDEEAKDRFWEAWGNAAEAAELQLPVANQTTAETADSVCSNATRAAFRVEHPAPGTPLPPLSVPTGPLDVQLERQIALCGGIIEHLAHYVARYDSEPYNCNQFMDRIVSMMNSSAHAAKVVGRLRGSYKKSPVSERSNKALRT